MKIYLSLTDPKTQGTVQWEVAQILALGTSQPELSGATFGEVSPLTSKVNVISQGDKSLQDFAESDGQPSDVFLQFKNAGSVVREMKLSQANCVGWSLYYVAPTATTPATLEERLKFTTVAPVKRTA